MRASLRVRLQEAYYWHVMRKTQKFVPWVARKLPTKLKYFVVVDTAVKVEPNRNPGGVMALEMLELLGKGKSWG